MNMYIKELFKRMIGALTLPITLKLKCNGSIGFSSKNTQKSTPKLSSKPGITIMNKLLWYCQKPKKFLKHYFCDLCS